MGLNLKGAIAGAAMLTLPTMQGCDGCNEADLLVNQVYLKNEIALLQRDREKIQEATIKFRTTCIQAITACAERNIRDIDKLTTDLAECADSDMASLKALHECQETCGTPRMPFYDPDTAVLIEENQNLREEVETLGGEVDALRHIVELITSQRDRCITAVGGGVQ